MKISLCGDVMLGRGVDQILPHPSDPALREPYVRDARAYVEMAEALNGLIPRPVDFGWPWGEALGALAEAAPEVRVVNLETSVTRSDDFALGKGIHYRMNPDNLACLNAARPDVSVLANNHVLDFGQKGLEETLHSLAAAGLRQAGAGRDVTEARRPAIVPVEGRRVLVFASGMGNSGVPVGWAATRSRPGVDFMFEPSTAGSAELLTRIAQVRKAGDIVVVSLHWGSNWGFDVSAGHVRFAHALVDGGVDIVFGHSSHHPRPVEVYRGRLVLYGCGDFIDDYEGIPGWESYRDDLRLLYVVSVEPGTGELLDLQMIPMQARRMRLEHAVGRDRDWLRSVLGRISARFGTRVRSGVDDALTIEWRSRP